MNTGTIELTKADNGLSKVTVERSRVVAVERLKSPEGTLWGTRIYLGSLRNALIVRESYSEVVHLVYGAARLNT